jgi:hypothetical protein
MTIIIIIGMALFFELERNILVIKNLQEVDHGKSEEIP